MSVKIQFRRGLAAAWTAADPLMAEGEMGLELDTGQFKVGDGVNIWSALPYGGIIGPAGPAGANGNTVLSGLVDPGPGDGVDGDFWINTATSFIFGPKAAGAWPAGVDLVGAVGPAGPAGADANLEVDAAGVPVVAAPTLILDFSPNFTVTNPVPGTAYVDIASAADREIIVPSGSGSAAINAAITALNALGGGTVRLDGLIDLDGDITMLSNVRLAGYGPGTGLRNNTANAYAINFVGATPTTYQIAAPTTKTDYFTCDTVGQAVNFVAGTAAILEDDAGTFDECQLVFVKVTGDAGTGIVRIYDQIGGDPGYGWNAATVAKPLIFSNAGLEDMDTQNTSSGSLSVMIQYAHTLRFDQVNFYECKVQMDDCGCVDFNECRWRSADVLNHARHVALNNWVDKVNFEACELRGAVSAFDWTGSKALRRIYVGNSNISGCTYGFLMNPSSPTATSISEFQIIGNRFSELEAPASGGGAAYVFYMTSVYNTEFNFVGNMAIRCDSNSIEIRSSGTSRTRRFNISSNEIQGAQQYLWGLIDGVFSGNLCTGPVQCSKGIQNVLFSNNNFVVGAIYLQGDATYSVDHCTIVGNTFVASLNVNPGTTGAFRNIFSNNVVGTFLSITGDAYDNVIIGNQVGTYLNVGTNGSSLNPRNVISGNSVLTNIVFTNPAQDDCIVSGNRIGGTRTLLTGTGNVVLDQDLLKTSGARVHSVTTVNAATYDLLPTDRTLHVTYTPTGTVAIDLKTAQLVAGRTITVKDAGGNAGANNITITTEGAETIDGAATYVINTNYSAVTIYCDGVGWWVV